MPKLLFGKSCLKSSPPDFDPTQFGWSRDEINIVLTPTSLSDNQEYIPESLLRLVNCNCKAEAPCKNGQCGCFKQQVHCSMFWGCNPTDCCNQANENDSDTEPGTDDSSDDGI